MKTTRIIYLICVISGLMSCSDFFESDNEGVIKTDGQKYASEIEARSGLFGLLEGLQEVATNYVLMGELRGDLMTTTENSSQEMHDIVEFNATADNSLLCERRYYALLNDCNYYISHLDTTVTKLVNGRSQKYLYPYLAQAKAIRAWTYLQLCLDYGTVDYTVSPILTETDTAKMQTITLDQLLPLLVSDLEEALPWAAVGSGDATSDDPGFSGSVNFGDYSARQLMFPIRFVLGELYMWQQDFQKAVSCYYQLIYNDEIRLCPYRNLYDETGTRVSSRNWQQQFTGFNYSDILTAIVANDDNSATRSRLYEMARTEYTIAPSVALMDIFDAQFYYTNSRTIAGDLRGVDATYRVTSGDDARAEIVKYNHMTASSRRYVAPVRGALVWLRYAECLNRLGKPKMVFYGFLKNGLNGNIINTYRDRPQMAGEVNGEPWINFGQDEDPATGATYQHFSNNSIGFHARGCGNTPMADAYTIEEQPTAADTLIWVENQLLDEYVLETAFEGNRFHDLMRISRYRGDNSFLADHVAAKFSHAERSAIRTKLMDTNNWYLPRTKK